MNISLITLDNIIIDNNKFFDNIFDGYNIYKHTNLVIVGTPVVIYNGLTSNILYIIKLYENFNSNWICFDLSDGRYTSLLIASKNCKKIFNMTNKNIKHDKIVNIICGYNSEFIDIDHKTILLGDNYNISILTIPKYQNQIYDILEAGSIPIVPSNYDDNIFTTKPYIKTENINKDIIDFKNDPEKLYDKYNEIMNIWRDYKIDTKKYFDNIYNDTFYNPNEYGIVGDTDEHFAKNDNEIIAITISVNYADKLSYIIDNARFFKKWYFVTKTSDNDTINYLKNTKYNNIEILFYDDFYINNAKFNKSGALNYAQKILHKLYPNDWMLMLDSDIILPENFNEYINKTMHTNKLYGIIRRDCNTKNDLINKKYNSGEYNCVYSFVGCYQLYHNKSIYYPEFSTGCGDCDMIFIGNFKNREIFKDTFCIHLGLGGINWEGRIEDTW